LLRKLFKQFKYTRLEREWDQVLKDGGYRSWENYLYHNDPGLNPEGRNLEEIFCGYPYYTIIDSSKLGVTHDSMWGPIHNCDNVINWCEKHCRNKFKHFWLPHIKDYKDQYSPIGTFGVDRLAMGFKDDRDLILFILIWS